MRTPAWCREQAAAIGPSCEYLIGELLADNALYRLRAAQGVIGLADKHDPGKLEAACAKAIAAGDPSYRTVKGILAAGAERDELPAAAGDGGAAAFLRGPRLVRERQEIGAAMAAGKLIVPIVQAGIDVKMAGLAGLECIPVDFASPGDAAVTVSSALEPLVRRHAEKQARQEQQEMLIALARSRLSF